MKMNKMMRLASVLLVAVLLSTCAISGTFAKYTTAANVSDSARVAKWGVSISMTGEGDKTTFKKEYASDTDGYTSATVSSTVDVVAPGTDGVLGSAFITGTPEVAVEVSYSTTSVTLSGDWMIDDDANTETPEVFYCPIVIKINGKAIDTSSATTIETWQTTVQNAINTNPGAKNQYAAGTDLSKLSDNSTNPAPVITWEWAFEGAEGSNQTDAKDTALGNNANVANQEPSLKFEMTVTITQID